MDAAEFGKRVALLRKKKGLTQGELAETLGISNKTISRWETGEGYPDVAIFLDLARALNTSVDYLLSGETPPVGDSKVSLKKRLFSEEETLKIVKILITINLAAFACMIIYLILATTSFCLWKHGYDCYDFTYSIGCISEVLLPVGPVICLICSGLTVLIGIIEKSKKLFIRGVIILFLSIATFDIGHLYALITYFFAP